MTANFKGRTSSTSERLAEESAMIGFREDPEVQEIAKLLLPRTKKIRKWVHLSSREKENFVAAGSDTSIVLKELVQSVYICLHAFPRVSVQNCALGNAKCCPVSCRKNEPRAQRRSRRD